MIDEDGFDKLRYLLKNVRCPVCHDRFSADDILTVDLREELWFLAVLCPECETKGLILVFVKDQEVQLEVLSSPKELADFVERGPITIDDVLDFYEFLRDFRGDMAEL